MLTNLAFFGKIYLVEVYQFIENIYLKDNYIEEYKVMRERIKLSISELKEIINKTKDVSEKIKELEKYINVDKNVLVTICRFIHDDSIIVSLLNKYSAQISRVDTLLMISKIENIEMLDKIDFKKLNLKETDLHVIKENGDDREIDIYLLVRDICKEAKLNYFKLIKNSNLMYNDTRNCALKIRKLPDEVLK